MAATRENVLAAIVQYVESNKRRAPAAEIAVIVGDTLPNVKLMIGELVTAGSITSSRGRNGGALPGGVTLEKKAAVAKVESETAEEPQIDNDVAAQFAALVAKMEEDEAAAVAV